MTRLYCYLLIALATGLCWSSVRAHDFWLLAHPFSAADGEPIEISLHVGENLVGRSLARRLRNYVEFSYVRGRQRVDVPGERGRDPAGIIHDYSRGGFAVGYQSIRRFGEFTRTKFSRYLRDEGLPAVTLPDGDRDIVEHYTRYAKVLVDGGTTDADSTLTDFGFRLELHALQNPYRLGHGAPLELRLTWDGRPASGLLVKAFCAAAADRQQRARSDGEGRVTIEPDCTGTWLVNAVRLEPSTESGIDFESYWTSLTFQRP